VTEEKREANSVRLAWPPAREDLQHLYVEQKLSAAKIARAYGVTYSSDKTAESTILYHLKKNGISRRDAAAHVRKVTDSMVDEWIDRYQKGESLKQIAGSSIDPVTVFNHLHKRGIRLRDKVEAQIKAVKKFEKSSFDGDAVEKAYMLGLVRGDLAVARHGRAIRVKTSSTHPAMMELVLSLVAPYGPTRVYPRFSKMVGYEWTVEGELDQSFEFLFSEKDVPPTESAADEMILGYLAGLFDAEGSIWMRKGRPFAPRLSFTNKDASMLDWVESQLTRLGLHHSRSLPDKKGVLHTRLWRNDDVLRVLRYLPLKHPEKKAKTRLIINGERNRTGLARKWECLLAHIDEDILEFVRLAKSESEKSNFSPT
jgi:LAGLIDADG-like domain